MSAVFADTFYWIAITNFSRCRPQEGQELYALERREPFACFPRNQRLKSGLHERGFLLNAGQLPGTLKEDFVDDDCSSLRHRHAP